MLYPEQPTWWEESNAISGLDLYPECSYLYAQSRSSRMPSVLAFEHGRIVSLDGESFGMGEKPDPGCSRRCHYAGLSSTRMCILQQLRAWLCWRLNLRRMPQSGRCACARLLTEASRQTCGLPRLCHTIRAGVNVRKPLSRQLKNWTRQRKIALFISWNVLDIGQGLTRLD